MLNVHLKSARKQFLSCYYILVPLPCQSMTTICNDFHHGTTYPALTLWIMIWHKY